jgi:predicted secreted protein
MDVTLLKTSGDDLGGADVALASKVEPEQEYTWEMHLTAPSKPGRYTTFYRMQTSHGVRFGHKIWADIQVVEPVKAKVKTAVASSSSD